MPNPPWMVSNKIRRHGGAPGQRGAGEVSSIKRRSIRQTVSESFATLKTLPGDDDLSAFTNGTKRDSDGNMLQYAPPLVLQSGPASLFRTQLCDRLAEKAGGSDGYAQGEVNQVYGFLL